MVTGDPKLLAEEVRSRVEDGVKRRYYRIGRTSGWYGGIATADCCGCNLKCVFCWSNRPREHPEIGKFYSPLEIGSILLKKAKGRGYKQVRISGNEPTIAKTHLLKVIEIIDHSGFDFILETNGTLIDKDFAVDLKDFNNLHVRVSLKGTSEGEFERLTETSGVGFRMQLEALNHLMKASVSCHPAVMVSFCKSQGIFDLKKQLSKIDPYLTRTLEEETIIVYPHVRERLIKKGLVGPRDI